MERPLGAAQEVEETAPYIVDCWSMIGSGVIVTGCVCGYVVLYMYSGGPPPAFGQPVSQQ